MKLCISVLEGSDGAVPIEIKFGSNTKIRQITSLAHEEMRICLFMSKVHLRIIRPGCSQLANGCPKALGRVITTAMNQLDKAIEQIIKEAIIAA